MKHVLVAYALPRADYDGIHGYAASVAGALDENPSVSASLLLRERSGVWRQEPGGPAASLQSWAREAGAQLLAFQYNPFSYSSVVAPKLGLEVLAARRASVRIAMTVHEPYVNTGSMRQRAVGSLQRVQLAGLASLADDLLITTERWRAMLPRKHANRAVLAVAGSNLPDCRSEREASRQALSAGPDCIVCVTFGLNALHQRVGHVQAALGAVHDAGTEVVHLNLGRNALPAPVAGVRVVRPGPTPAQELAALLSAGDLFLAPYTDGATTRRTGLAAAMQHGLATVATATWDRTAPWAVGGIQLATSEGSFATAAAELAADTELRLRCGIEARAAFERSLDRRAVVRPYLALACR